MKEFVRFVLRIPNDLHASLKAEAARQHRSLHAQILYLLMEKKEDSQ